MVRRIFVEKLEGFTVEADHLKKDLVNNLNLSEVKKVRVVISYEMDNMDEETFEIAKKNVFSEPNVDTVFESTDSFDSELVFRMELLPGQFDQRADSAEQCIQLMTQGERPIIRASKVICVYGKLSKEEKNKIKSYLINPVESHEISFDKNLVLEIENIRPVDVSIYEGFINLNNSEISIFKDKQGFAMTVNDLIHIKDYFIKEKRNPTVTELKAIDTYWSDHCRHTTFMTEITNVTIEKNNFSKAIEKAFNTYLSDREDLYKNRNKAMCLMDLATITTKKLLKAGKMDDLDISEEINACSINVKVDVDGVDEDYLIMFKNETHNHPTEIEPFGGAATCLGGAIRDPLSGRSFVYQAMRITGAADPRTSIEDTIPGKLPQRTITRGATKGYSSYGNQIGVTTGFVKEYYDDGFIAKRMEVGAVIAATPKSEVIREIPNPGDVVILVGGLTGRDGCGGATGSSKEHTEDSILECGAEVQKGNAPIERKLQRLFRNEELSKMIKRCNDFGAGGVSVAIGEIADSIDINLDKVPKKYEGLDGTELAISESQERMAVVVIKENVDRFIELSAKENLEAVEVASITDSGRLRIFWREKAIFDISREFLDTNGRRNTTEINIVPPTNENNYFSKKEITKSIEDIVFETLTDINVASQKGMVEHFDSTIGASSVLMPFGGKTYQTPIEGMVAKIPVKGIETKTGTIMTHGYSPSLAKWSPFHGGIYAVVDSIAKVVAIGGLAENSRLTFQEYFEKLGNNPSKWGKPMAALLGASLAQDGFEIAAIGGKDSMSGTFKDINVPPTLISFAVKPVNVEEVITPEFKNTNSKLILFKADRNEDETPKFEILNKNYSKINELIISKDIFSAYTVSEGGLLSSLVKMSFGNKIGFELFNTDISNLLQRNIGSIVVEVSNDFNESLLLGTSFEVVGKTIFKNEFVFNNKNISLDKIEKAWENTLNSTFPISEDLEGKLEKISYKTKKIAKSKKLYNRPKVVIPAFPGTNCEDDTKKAFIKAGADVKIVMIRNLKAEWIKESIEELAKEISTAQIIALPGGFSAGDEPDGSGKFIASVFKNPLIKEQVSDLLNNRDGLIIGICNGFQALVKLGLLPYGEIKPLDSDCPTLTYNKLGRHIARYAKTRISSNLSPWLSGVEVGDIHEVALSHGEGRFYANDETLKSLIKNGQIATQYVDIDGNPSYDGKINPNGSLYSIEAITSADGRILGKMGHTERVGKNVAKNIYGEKEMKIFEAGVNYFRGM